MVIHAKNFHYLLQEYVNNLTGIRLLILKMVVYSARAGIIKISSWPLDFAETKSSAKAHLMENKTDSCYSFPMYNNVFLHTSFKAHRYTRKVPTPPTTV